MKTEELTALGLSGEQARGILALASGELTALHGELNAANDTIRSLREAAESFDGSDITKLRGELESLRSRYDADLGAARLNGALDAALLTAKARDPRAVRPFLDMSRLSLDGDRLCGLDEQLAALREDKAFLFDEPFPLRTGVRHNQSSMRFGSSRDEANAALRAALSRN